MSVALASLSSNNLGDSNDCEAPNKLRLEFSYPSSIFADPKMRLTGKDPKMLLSSSISMSTQSRSKRIELDIHGGGGGTSFFAGLVVRQYPIFHTSSPIRRHPLSLRDLKL